MLLRGIMILLLAGLGGGWLNSMLAPAGPSGDANAQNAGASTADMADISAIVSHNMDAFMARDIDAVMDDYAENAVLITSDGVYTGVDSIRTRLQKAMQNGDQSEAPFTVTNTQISGPVAYVQWDWAMADGSELNGSDTIIVSHGKISKQTVAYFVSKAAPDSAVEEPQTDAPDDAES